MTVTDRLSSQFHLILPAGTQVVTRVEIQGADGQVLAPCGAVGEIVKAPDDGSHSYRVRFASGVETALRRHEWPKIATFCWRSNAAKWNGAM